MQKYTLLVLCFVISIHLYPCDACGNASTGGYMGILPQYSKHFVGLRYQFRYFSSTSISNPGARNTEYYHTWNVWGRISPHKRVQIYLNLPVHYFKQIDQGLNRELAGPGDIWTMVQYQVIRSPDSSSKKMRQSLFLGGGIKLPTGRYNIYDSQGFYDRNLQPGTGSWDVMFSAQYTIRWKGWGINAEGNGKISTLNPDNYLYGHKLNMNLKGFYWFKGKKISCLASGGINYDYATRDVYMHQAVPNSGGHLLGGSVSVDVYFKRLSIGSEIRIPIYSQMSQGLLNPGPQLMSQLMFMF